jgi:hypothetical protein
VSAPEIIRDRRFGTEIAHLLQTALFIFVFTISIGILNGTDIVDFDQKVILAHVHTGTLGYLTIAVFAAALWLFGDAPMDRGLVQFTRFLAYAAIVVFIGYNIAFLATYGEMRPAIGGLALLVIAGMLVFVAIQAREVEELTTPHVGVIVAVLTSVVGAVIGVLLGMRIATGDNWIPEGGEDAHPATMVVGFLVPVAAALGEWALTWPKPAPVTRAGVIQMALPFIGGIMLMVGLLWDIDPLVQISLPLELLGIGIFLWRMRSPLLGSLDFARPWQTRFAAVSPIYLMVVIALFIFLIADYEGDADLIPTHKILAVDHLTFIGAMTNAIFAILLAITSARIARWPIVPALIFVTMNVGLILFMVGLYTEETTLKRIGTPVLGGALLVSVALFTWALSFSGEEPEAASAVP